MKTPHRLIHDAKEAGVITDEEWRAFMRARNESYDEKCDLVLTGGDSYDFLHSAFVWYKSYQGHDFWLKVANKLWDYEASKQESKQ